MVFSIPGWERLPGWGNPNDPGASGTRLFRSYICTYLLCIRMDLQLLPPYIR